MSKKANTKSIRKVSVRVNGVRKYFYGRTLGEARAKRDAATANAQYNLDMTYGELAQAWLDSIAYHVAADTYQGYESILNYHVLPAFKLMKLKELNKIIFQQFINVKLDSGLATRTVEYIYIVTKAPLNMAVDDGVMPTNPMRSVRRPKVVKTREMVALNETQSKRLLGAITNPDHHCLFSLALATGMRRSEVLGLRWADVDFDRSTVTVRQTVLKVKAVTIISPTTKNTTSRRTVAVADKVMAELKKQRLRDYERMFKTAAWVNNDLVFPGDNGGPRNPDWVTKLARDLGKALNLPKGFSFHSLRHTHATLLLKAGVNPKLVQSRLGHASITQTMDTYSHVMPEMDAEVADRIAGIL